MNDELKPCPMCGGPAEMDTLRGYRRWSDGSVGNAIAVYCTECTLEISVCRDDVPDIEPEQVAEMWNRRAQPAAQALPSITEQQSKWGRLYTAANALVVKMGFIGSMQADSTEMESLKDKLHDLDGGEWMPGLMPPAQPAAPSVCSSCDGTGKISGLPCAWCMQSAAPSVAPEPVAWEGGEEWESLAWELCADENGEDACNELIWEGGPIPEPWGDRWMKYEGEAKRLIALVHKHAAHPPRAPLTRDEIRSIFMAHGFTIKEGCDDLKEYVYEAARALEQAHGIGAAK